MPPQGGAVLLVMGRRTGSYEDIRTYGNFDMETGKMERQFILIYVIRLVCILLLLVSWATPNLFAGQPSGSAGGKSGKEYKNEVSSETIVQLYELDNALITPIYQYLRADLDSSGHAGVSFHMYGWGRYDASGNASFSDNPDGDLLYGYLEYTRPERGFALRFGRQHIFDGVLNDSIDGLGITESISKNLTFSAYAGYPVAISSENGYSGDSFWGARMATTWAERYDIGVTFKKIDSNSNEDEKKVGIDFSASLPAIPGNMHLYGVSSYNMITKGWGEHSYEAQWDVSQFSLRPFYQQYSYRDFFDTGDNSANPFRFLAGTDEVLSVAGADIVWHRFSQVDICAEVKQNDFDQSNNGATYWEGNITYHPGVNNRFGGSVGRMQGKTSQTRYSMSRLFSHVKIPSSFAPLESFNGDITYTSYDEPPPISGTSSSIYLSMGLGAQFTPSLVVIFSGEWSRDPYFDSNTKGLIKLRWNY